MDTHPQYKNKKLIVFDLDGTLTESKSPMDPEMNSVLSALLGKTKVAVIGGGHFPQFEKQFVSRLNCSPELLGNLFLFPTTASSFYRYSKGWELVYSHLLSSDQKRVIFSAFEEALTELEYTPPKQIYGEVLEDRGSQISFSPLGQKIVDVLGEKGIALKMEWGATSWRPRIAEAVSKRLPEFNVKMGGISTIDVTVKGIDKGYGLRQIEKHLRIPITDMFFIGDAIFPGGNDYAVVPTGVHHLKIDGPHHTKKIIQDILGI